MCKNNSKWLSLIFEKVIQMVKNHNKIDIYDELNSDLYSIQHTCAYLYIYISILDCNR